MDDLVARDGREGRRAEVAGREGVWRWECDDEEHEEVAACKRRETMTTHCT